MFWVRPDELDAANASKQLPMHPPNPPHPINPSLLIAAKARGGLNRDANHVFSES
jgi:hypothetical protein